MAPNLSRFLYRPIRMTTMYKSLYNFEQIYYTNIASKNKNAAAFAVALKLLIEISTLSKFVEHCAIHMSIWTISSARKILFVIYAKCFCNSSGNGRTS